MMLELEIYPSRQYVDGLAQFICKGVNDARKILA